MPRRGARFKSTAVQVDVGAAPGRGAAPDSVPGSGPGGSPARPVADPADGELGHHREELRLVARKTAKAAEVRTQLSLRCARAPERSAEAAHGVSHHPADEIFLMREVVMERRDVDADRCGDLARAEALEATCRKDLVPRGDQRVLPWLCRSCRLTLNQSDD